MPDRKKGSKAQSFPVRRPSIVITPSRAKPFAIDCRELPSFGIIPEVGQRASLAWYDPPQWKITNVTEMHAVRAALVHDVEGVEIQTNEWEPETGWRPDRTMYGRLTDKTAQWLAMDYRLEDDTRRLYTFLDEGFERDWGEFLRRCEDTGRLIQRKDGSFRLRKAHRAS